MSLSKQEFTNAGRNMLGRAQNGEVLHINKIVVGSGVAAAPSDLWPLTDPIQEQTPLVNISSTRDLGNGVLLVEGNFRSDMMGSSFYLRELGIYAHIGSETDQLYSIANVFADPPDFIDPSALTIQVFKIKLIVDRIPTGSINVSISPSEAVSGENLGSDTEGPGWYDSTAGNILKFKRATAGAHIKLTESSDGNSVQIAVKTVETDLDLYVPTSNPEAPKPEVAFATIQAALDSVADLLIPSNRFVTIHVYSGNFTVTSPTVVDHPNASQIKIIGKDIIARSITGAITSTGTAPTIDVTVTVPSGITGINVGDVVAIFDAPDGRLEQCGYVLSTHPTPQPHAVIRMRSIVAPPASMNVLATTKLLIFPTQYLVTAPAGMNVFNCLQGVGLIKNFAMRSTAPIATAGGAAMRCNGDGAIENFVVVGFNMGFGVANGNLNVTPIVACCQCQVGMEVAPYAGCVTQPPTSWNRLVFSGNLTYGIWISGGTYYPFGLANTWAIGNVTGIRSDRGLFEHGTGGGATQGGIVVAFNNVGCYAAIGGVVLCANDSPNIVDGNVTWDCVAVESSQISIVHNSRIVGLKLQPPHQVLGPSGGYISMTTP
jgi:hypothetical protein